MPDPSLVVQPTSVPTDLFLAIRCIVCSEASYRDWDLLDLHVGRAGLEGVLDHVEAVLVANGMTRLMEERAWFKRQILTNPQRN